MISFVHSLPSRLLPTSMPLHQPSFAKPTWLFEPVYRISPFRCQRRRLHHLQPSNATRVATWKTTQQRNFEAKEAATAGMPICRARVHSTRQTLHRPHRRSEPASIGRLSVRPACRRPLLLRAQYSKSVESLQGRDSPEATRWQIASRAREAAAVMPEETLQRICETQCRRQVLLAVS